MVLITIGNIIAYFISCKKSNSTIMKILSAFYVAGCSLRAILPRIDVERICFVESWLSCTFIGRCFATCAELSFILQFCITFNHLAGDIGKKVPNSSHRMSYIQAFSKLAFVSNILAQSFCWLGVTTTRQIWHVYEESIWTITIFTMTICAISMLPYFAYIKEENESVKDSKIFLRFFLVGGPLYVLYMLAVDIPMYYKRWEADELRGARYFSFVEGVKDSMECKLVTQNLAVWKEDMSWITLYFSVAVWTSIWLIRAPRIAEKAKAN